MTTKHINTCSRQFLVDCSAGLIATAQLGGPLFCIHTAEDPHPDGVHMLGMFRRARNGGHYPLSSSSTSMSPTARGRGGRGSDGRRNRCASRISKRYSAVSQWCRGAVAGSVGMLVVCAGWSVLFGGGEGKGVLHQKEAVVQEVMVENGKRCPVSYLDCFFSTL